MYCSLRFYVDEISETVDSRLILQIFEVFSQMLQKKYDYIEHCILSSENDTITSHKFLYDINGHNSFADYIITPMQIDNHGEIVAQTVSATCEHAWNLLYSNIYVSIRFPLDRNPMIIAVDYQNHSKAMTFEQYASLISILQQLGFHINNSFYHIYNRMNTVTTLDRGQLGSFVSLADRKNIKNSVVHHMKNCIDHIMDIFCANSIPSRMLSNDTKQSIVQLLGNNAKEIGDSYVFALPDVENLKTTYRIRHYTLIKKLQNLFKSNNIMS